MRRFGVTTLVALCGATVLSAPSDARAAPAAVSVRNNRFEPADVLVKRGDPVTWSWADDGYGRYRTHNVTGYSGAEFSSGDKAGPATYSQSFPTVGTVGYRCTIHSTLSSTDECSGMCGTIDVRHDIEPPFIRIDAPAQFQAFVSTAVTTPVTIRGISTDDVAVARVELRLAHTGFGMQTPSVTCSGCGTANATWTSSLSLLPGHYYAYADGYDTSGHRSTSSRTDFFVI